MKGYLRPFQRIVRLYRDSNPRRDEMKDDGPFRHTLAGWNFWNKTLEFYSWSPLWLRRWPRNLRPLASVGSHLASVCPKGQSSFI